MCDFNYFGGAERDRTADLLNAIRGSALVAQGKSTNSVSLERLSREFDSASSGKR